ncbi:MAG TPA: nuclear transport factor 2 family protein [Stenotrophomonas sp.]|nr:nuclear transport factor 2 family protein [Stenotrophomonas sp.]
MRLLWVVAFFGVIAGIYQWGGNRLDEAQVREFYDQAQTALAEQDDQTLCAMLAPDFEQVTLYRADNQQARKVVSREKYCHDLARTMAQLRSIREATGGEVPVEHEQTITRITVAPDQRSAEVETRTLVSAPGMRMTARTRDTVVRERWRMAIRRSEGTAFIGPAPL